jgi:hypothetical protein
MISRDEGLHTDFACHLYELLQNRWVEGSWAAACCRAASPRHGPSLLLSSSALPLHKALLHGSQRPRAAQR